MNQQALNQYQSVSLQTEVHQASPFRLIQMLFEGGIARLNGARGALQRGNIEQKGIMLGKAVSIVGGLREALNKEVDSELPENLDRLYEYMQYRLLDANRNSDEEAVVEVLDLLQTLKEAWDAITPES